MLALRECLLLLFFERLAARLAVLLIGVVGERQEVFTVAERRLLEKPVREHCLHVLAHVFGRIGGACRDFVEIAEIAQANGIAVALETVHEVQALDAHREQGAACDRRRRKNASHENRARANRENRSSEARHAQNDAPSDERDANAALPAGVRVNRRHLLFATLLGLREGILFLAPSNAIRRRA